MRWADVSTEVASRTISGWREAMSGTLPQDALATIVARAAARAPHEAPLVVLFADAFRAAWDYVARSPLERGGLLLGEPLVAAQGGAEPALVFVRAAIPGVEDDATEFSLRLHTGVWNAARAALLPGEVVVGWFHSHPDIGAFFSATDRRTQSGFFPHPFSVGWVIDPVRGEQAWFVGPRSVELPADAIVPISPGEP